MGTRALSADGAAYAGSWRRSGDLAGLRTHPGRSAAVLSKPGRRDLLWTGSPAIRFGSATIAAADQQSRQCLHAALTGAKRATHLRALRTRLPFAPVRRASDATWRQECEEARRCRRRSEASGSSALPLVDRCRIRALPRLSNPKDSCLRQVSAQIESRVR